MCPWPNPALRGPCPTCEPKCPKPDPSSLLVGLERKVTCFLLCSRSPRLSPTPAPYKSHASATPFGCCIPVLTHPLLPPPTLNASPASHSSCSGLTDLTSLTSSPSCTSYSILLLALLNFYSVPSSEKGASTASISGLLLGLNDMMGVRQLA